MPVTTPEPRLPLEPEEYPLYKPPSRLGCSALSLITLITVLVFAFLFWQVTPRVVKGIGGLNPANLLTNDQGTPISAVSDSTESGTPGVADGGALETPVPIVSPTPVRTCVKVTGTGNQGTPLRAEPKSSAASVIKDAKGKSLNVGEGAIFEVVGPDVTA